MSICIVYVNNHVMLQGSFRGEIRRGEFIEGPHKACEGVASGIASVCPALLGNSHPVEALFLGAV